MGNRKNILVEVGSILIFSLGVFVLISLVTFNAGDPQLWSKSLRIAENACGRVGALVSLMTFDCLGLGAFLLPLALFILTPAIHRREGLMKLLGSLVAWTVTLGALTVLVALQKKTWSYGGALLLTGGAFGTWAAEELKQHFNSVGASLVVLFFFFASIVIATPISVVDLLGRILNGTFLGGAHLGKGLGHFFFQWIPHAMPKIRDSSKQVIAVKSSLISAIAVDRQADETLDEVLLHDTLLEEVSLESDAEPNSTLGPVSVLDPEFDSASEPELDFLLSETPLESAKAPTPPPFQILPRDAEKVTRVIPKASRGQWQLPTIEFLRNPPTIQSSVDRDKLIANSQILTQKFLDFGIDGEVTAVRPGPVITLYEFKPGPGVKVSRIASLADDLSMALSAQSVRILAPLPGKSVVGIEIPSDAREIVYLREFLQHPDFYGPKHMIPVVMGKDIGGQTYLSDLARMPHVLCAGQTGSGKSVFMNGLICSLFYRFTPDELRMILVDPKFIEFRAYQDIPHLLLPVVDDPKQASTALKWAVREMDRRYRILAKLGARNLASFNQKVEEMGSDVVRDLLYAEDSSTESSQSAMGNDWVEAFDPDETGAPRVSKLPYIVVIIDELADLMMIAKKDVEISIARIAQKARAAGIHLVIATQRPSTDVVTGLIKANLPSRVSFQLASYVDSKTILDRAGAERLLGQGDMLFIPPGVSQTVRLHGAYLDDEEIRKITSFLKSQGKPTYRDEILIEDDSDEDGEDGGSVEDDPLFADAVELVKRSKHASASFLQRHFKVGYNRAARMIETMEHRGIVGPQDGARPREVRI